jgi:CheY-like chemotaxis protein
MDEPQKLALIVQSNRLQGLMWQALLKSQKLAVILEPANGDLADCISQIATAGLTLPEIIVLDAEAAELNPYEFCRWCRDAFPKVQVFLTRCRQLPVSDIERRWTQQQGATGFLGGFNRDSLMTNATENVKHILTSLDYPFLNEKALLMVLLNIRRQLGTTQAAVDVPTSTASRQDRSNGQARAPKLSSGSPKGSTTAASGSGNLPTPDPLNDLDWVASGLRSLGNKLTSASPQDSFAPPPSIKSNTLPKPSAPEKVSIDGAAVRRYRGIAY